MANDLCSYRASIGLFYSSTHRIVLHNKTMLHFSLFSELVKLIGLYSKLIANSLVVVRGNIENIQFVLLLVTIILLSNDISENPGPEINETAFGGLTIFHLNIRSIRNKIDSILHLLDHDILCFTETHLDNSVTNDALEIPGYCNIIRKDRTGIGIGLGGGIILYYKDYIKVERRCDLEMPDMESLWIEIKTKPHNTLVNVLYRSPQFTDSNFWTAVNQAFTLAF